MAGSYPMTTGRCLVPEFDRDAVRNALVFSGGCPIGKLLAGERAKDRARLATIAECGPRQVVQGELR